ncbi:MAG TPA: hypothetical protein VL403_17365 [Candidatus Kryptonia bacterium]|nr:hypothetical protein [Candidatus Kryptonia bacterium]
MRFDVNFAVYSVDDLVLQGVAPIFAGNTSKTGSSDTNFSLIAVAAGKATVQLEVTYGTELQCDDGHGGFYFYPGPDHTVTSPSYVVEVGSVVPPSSSCIGDCDGDGHLSIDELVKGVNIALGNLPFDACPAFDCTSDCQPGPGGTRLVDVACLVRAVNIALDGCPPSPCQSDADCDDGNACSIDHCTTTGCLHECVCD